MAYNALEAAGLAEDAPRRAGTLSHGGKRQLEIAMCLATKPRVLLLDEPGSGLDSNETENLQDVLLDIVQDDIGVLLIEHDVDLVMAVSANIYVIDFGKLIAEGSPTEISRNEAVRAAYLGAEAAGLDEQEDEDEEVSDAAPARG